MPPVRTDKTSASRNAGTLAVFGFMPVAKEDALARAAKLPSQAPDAAKSSVQQIRKVPRPKAARCSAKGTARASFDGEVDWKKRLEAKVGPATTAIVLTGDFVLTPQHIDDLVSHSTSCDKVKSFEFNYHDVGYGAKNDATALTDDCIAKLARAFPTLQTVKLPGTSDLTDKSLIAFCEHCPDLKVLELTAASRRQTMIAGEGFRVVKERPEWAPGLRKMKLSAACHTHEKTFMSAMREMSKAREQLLINLVNVGERKKWGDWELEIWDRGTYRKGRKQPCW